MTDSDSPLPGQEDELAALLALALDGTDETRLRLMTRWLLMRQDVDRVADLERLRQSGMLPNIMKV